MSDLDHLRTQISKLDQTITEALIQRMRLSVDVGIYKKDNGLPVLNMGREKEILDSLSESEFATQLKEIYAAILKTSRELQA